MSQGGYAYTWKGQLPTRTRPNAVYSPKVFLGGIPWDIGEAALLATFKPFGAIKIEWPGRGGVNAPPNGGRDNGHGGHGPLMNAVGDAYMMGARGRRHSGCKWSNLFKCIKALDS